MFSWKVWSFVTCAHCALLLFLLFSEPISIKKPLKQKTTVRTIALKQNNNAIKSALAFLDEPIQRPPSPPSPPPVEIEETVDSPTPPEPSTSNLDPSPLVVPDPSPSFSQTTKKIKKQVAPTPTPKAKPTVAKSVEKPKSPSKSKEIATKKNPTKPSQAQKEKMLSMMKESLALMDKTTGSSLGTSKGKKGGGTSATAFGKIDSLASEHLSSADGAATYQEELIAYLKHLLQLPEIGEVRLRLTLTDTGNVSKLVVLEASSDKNRNYVEKKIPTLSFPPFGSRLKGEKSHTFPVTLTGY